jgi:hypothetical protein
MNEKAQPRYGEKGNEDTPSTSIEARLKEGQLRNCALSVPDLNKLKDLVKQIGEKLATRNATLLSEDFQEEWRQKTSFHGGQICLRYESGTIQIYNEIQEVNFENLSDTPIYITFDTGQTFYNEYQITPTEYIRIRLDLSKPTAISNYDPFNSETPNLSNFEVQSLDPMVTEGNCKLINDFFIKRQTMRGLLHSSVFYGWFYALCIVPAALLLAALAEEQFLSTILVSSTLRAAGSLYCFLMFCLSFRFLVSSLRWMYPVVEISGQKSHPLRIWIATLALAIPTTLLGRAITYFVEKFATGN